MVILQAILVYLFILVKYLVVLPTPNGYYSYVYCWWRFHGWWNLL